MSECRVQLKATSLKRLQEEAEEESEESTGAEEEESEASYLLALHCGTEPLRSPAKSLNPKMKSLNLCSDQFLYQSMMIFVS